ncbi:uncharacterized protein EV422DRAFT_511115 [Fimicolochytrium jonesii]|uniref:uncharacterized protein n=1 Tax=Fimicolochytrium jonesii TaxID=1396493 RepID=UPI0022FE0D36|nr:uncharacterized protein EV422DRAFT_511115 [Fimicolochytrium jonesii]KAI8826701.1 hypothetical protein EV422DRAFT_511115 [Fimicolochytrium jonesii]
MFPKKVCLSLFICLLALTPSIFAFNFFDFFNDGGQQQQNQGQQNESAEGQRAATERGCPGYICPQTAHCVSTPLACPCPNPTEKKCVVGSWYVCVRGDQTCGTITKLATGLNEGHSEL